MCQVARRVFAFALAVPLLAGCGFGTATILGVSGGGGGGGTPPPPAATGLNAVAIAPTAVLLTWIDNAANETGYAIEQRVAGSAAFVEVAQTSPDSTAFAASGLQPQTGYQFRVVALNSGGRSASTEVAAITPAAVRIDAFVPDSVTNDAPQPVQVRGRGFTEVRPGFAATLRFGGVPAAQLTIVADDAIEAVPPGGLLGDVGVTFDNGYETVTLPAAITCFGPAPVFATNDLRVNITPVGVAGSDDPELACSGRFVYSVWVDRRLGLNADVFFNRSVDGGASWSTNESRLDTNAPGASEAGDLEIAVDGSNVYVVWQDDRNGAVDLYFNRSTDHGATWLPVDVRLDTDAPGAAGSLDPEIAASGGRVYVTWQDDRNGRSDVYLNRSLDAGATWLAQDVRVNDDQSPAGGCRDPEIRCAGDSVYIGWVDLRHGASDIYFDRSTDAGATWLPSDVRIETDALGVAPSSNVEFCVVDTRVVAVWLDQRNGLADVYSNHSEDGGATWSAADVRLDTDAAGAAESLDPEICCAGDRVYVAWRDSRDGGFAVYGSRSLDAGRTWLVNDRRIDRVVGPNLAIGVVIGCSGERVFVAWSDPRGGGFDVRFNDSSDGGLTWRVADQRLDTNPAGAADSGPPQLCVDGARIYCAWLDARDGVNTVGIYCNRRLP